jgi:hypothetical protein
VALDRANWLHAGMLRLCILIGAGFPEKLRQQQFQSAPLIALLGRSFPFLLRRLIFVEGPSISKLLNLSHIESIP